MADVYDEAGQRLRVDPFYVAPEALQELPESARLSNSEISNISTKVRGAEVTTFIAMLPQSAESGGGAQALYDATQEQGVYLVLLPDGRFDAGASRGLPITGSEADQAAKDAREAAGKDLRGFLSGFVDNVNTLAAGSAGAPADGASGQPGGDDAGAGLLTLGILALAGGGGFLLYRRNKRARELADVATVRAVVDEDITAYGEELAALDLDVRMADEDTRQDYSAALDHYEQAKSMTETAEKPADVQMVTRNLEEGRWLLARVRARLAGEPLPERRPPCFFDPRHGPSVEDIEWAPPGGQPRLIPTCAADATRIKDGVEPDVRLVPVGDDRRPYWEAGRAYAPWAGGYFGGMLPAFMWGTMLGSMWGGPHTFDQGASGFDSGGFDSGDSNWSSGGGFDSGSGGWSGGGGFDGGGFDGGGGWS